MRSVTAMVPSGVLFRRKVKPDIPVSPTPVTVIERVWPTPALDGETDVITGSKDMVIGDEAAKVGGDVATPTVTAPSTFPSTVGGVPATPTLRLPVTF